VATPELTAAPPVAPSPSQPFVLRGRRLARFFLRLQQPDQLAPLASLPPGSGLIQIPVKGAPILLVRNPLHARQVLITNQDSYIKGIDYKILAVLLGNGLLTNFDQESWQRQRSLVQPLFAKRHLAPMGEHMADATGDWLDRLDATQARNPDQTLELNSAMMGLTLDVVGRALFGANIDQRSTGVVGSAMTDVLHAASANFRMVGLYRALSRVRGVEFDDLLKLRSRHWRRAQKAITSLDSIVDGLIDDAIARPADGEREDLLALLLAARDEEGGGTMARQQVRDEVMTFLGAGHETTANAMTWMWLLLSQHPEARRRMQAEVDEVLDGRRPTFADVDRLPWTMAVLQESMRLYPPVPAVSRVAIRRDEIDGVKVPAGTVLIILPYLMHRDPGVWANPEGFDPERFMPGHPSAVGRPRQAFMPFGAGRRICVGSGFALMEGVLLAAMTAQRYEFDLVPGTRIRREVAITLRPRDGLPVMVRRRVGAPPLDHSPAVDPTREATGEPACPVDHAAPATPDRGSDPGATSGGAPGCPVPH
jgi:cytochrome P450